MSFQLDCHPASEEETLAAHRNVYDVWPMDADPDIHLAKRKDSPKSLRANYFVGTIDGVVATSLQSFPTQFQVEGKPVRGIQIGSVHTHGDFRKQGYAELLIDFTEKYEAERGVGLSVLYCDIAIGYYAKMGYQIAPSKSGWFHTEDWPEERLTDAPQLVDIDVREALPAMMQLHQTTLAKRPAGIVRDQDYWEYTLRKFPDDLFWGLRDSEGELVGYLRITTAKQVGQIADWVCRDDEPGLTESLLRGAVRKAKAVGLDRVGGWLPDEEVVRGLVELKDRPKQITMFKSLHESVELSEPVLNSANYFTMIDHV